MREALPVACRTADYRRLTDDFEESYRANGVAERFYLLVANCIQVYNRDLFIRPQGGGK
ncbi:MAG: hypothetical protein AVDCRST_MAG87-3245 [uncultured Thermomicrobiales bacterium]|uniref:Uncharacterized protein n=1 Tax=uncultured Thermomicrobiales bacterium TaxID=1645740 RepID=A0A6J4VQD0_9BACT|nr:MAG: hypothetical protein AVDCRST_MAG87-3245 [uncultured Thermomicrobiales bacterium]